MVSRDPRRIRHRSDHRVQEVSADHQEVEEMDVELDILWRLKHQNNEGDRLPRWIGSIRSHLEGTPHLAAMIDVGVHQDPEIGSQERATVPKARDDRRDVPHRGLRCDHHVEDNHQGAQGVLTTDHLDQTDPSRRDTLRPSDKESVMIAVCGASRDAKESLAKTVDSAGKEICRYHLQGKCSRGDKCKYSHGQPEGQDAKRTENRKTTPPPRKKSPAAPVETIEEIEPTEVCTTMYWSDDEASDMEPAMPSRQNNTSVKHVSFNDKVEIREYQVDNLQVGLTKTLSRRWRAKAIPVDASAQRSFKAEKDAIKRAMRWRASMDDDADETAVAAVARRWLIDTGSAYDLVSTKDAIEDPKKRLQKPLLMQTASGVMEANKRATEKVNTLRSTITPLLLDSTPDVLSVGRRCMTEGYSFHWDSGAYPYFIDKKGRRISMTVDRYIPYLDDAPEVVTPVDVHSGYIREPEDDLFLVEGE
eukprot:1827943-Amphidinium_carterae.1